MPSKQCQRLCVGITGSINVLQAVEYLTTLRQEFAEEIVTIVTESAQRMVPASTIRQYCTVVAAGWTHPDMGAPHIDLPASSELLLIMPATANTVAKAAHGIADTNVLAAISTTDRPVIFAPAMHAASWKSAPITRAVAQLRQDGYLVVDPAPAFSITAGVEGGGMMAPKQDVLAMCRHALSRAQAASYVAEATADPPRSPSLLASRSNVLGQ